LSIKQDALTASEERLNLAMQGSDLALFDWNISTGAVELSEQWASILGDSSRATVASIQELALLVNPDDRPRLQKELRAVLSGAQDFYAVEHRVKTSRGEWRWIHSRGKVVERDANGRARRMTGTNADITDRKLVEQMKNEFVGNVSHELRTPLTVIVASLSLLKEELVQLTPDQRMMLAMACDNSARLHALVNDILDFEKITSGAMPFDLQPVALEPFLLRALELNRVYAQRFDVRYELRRPLPEVTVEADPERLMQVVTNLLSNAAKFSPAGAAVTISASHEGEWVRISVTDRGPGIALEFRSRIFQKFAQADSSDTRQEGGTGLGLSICKAIIEKLGGRIGYESEPGEGATFYVDLTRGADAA
jgi:PAS domain S-box-containing protein